MLTAKRLDERMRLRPCCRSRPTHRRGGRCPSHTTRVLTPRRGSAGSRRFVERDQAADGGFVPAQLARDAAERPALGPQVPHPRHFFDRRRRRSAPDPWCARRLRRARSKLRLNPRGPRSMFIDVVPQILCKRPPNSSDVAADVRCDSGLLHPALPHRENAGELAEK